MSVSCRRPLLLFLLALAAISPPVAAAKKKSLPAPAEGASQAAPAQAAELPPVPADLPPRFREFVDLAGPLLSAKERAAFLALKQDYQRDAFIRQFWLVRDPFPQTVRNEFQERWEMRARAAKEKFG